MMDGSSSFDAAPSVPSTAAAESYLIMGNISKSRNIGNMVRSAVGFGCTCVLVVGLKKQVSFFGSFGTHKHVKFHFFASLGEVRAWLKALPDGGCHIFGVEITAGARSVCDHSQFHRRSAFMVGNEGSGMSEAQMAICDSFVYIPQCGTGTASLNVNVATAIVLHHFAIFASFAECARDESHPYKFKVAKRPQVTAETPRTAEELAVRAARASKRAAREEAEARATTAPALADGGAVDIFAS
jgi:tRNA(Leu) C34 or U34 (ribose-2'-O)-methylase TrmL